MSQFYEGSGYQNLLDEIDSNLLEKRELLLAEIENGVLEGIYTIARDIAIKFLQQTGQFIEPNQQTAYVEKITSQIVEGLKANLEGKEALSTLKNKVSRSLLPLTEPRLQNIVAIPSSVIMFSSIEASLRKDLWKINKDGIAYLEHRAKGNPNNYIEHNITTPGDITLLPWEEAQQIIDKFGFITAKLHLIFAAHAMKTDTPWTSKFCLKATDIIREIAWDKNHQKTKAEKMLEIASTAFALDCLLVKATWIEGVNQKGKIIASTPIGRVWNIHITPVGQLNLEGKIEQPDEIYINVQPGLWTQDFLNRAGAKSKEALYQFSYLAQRILKIDPYHNELALRLAIYLTLNSRVHLNGKYKVKELLETVLPKIAIYEARSEHRQAYKFKKRWDNTINLLIELGWQIEFDSESYPQWLRPGSKEKKPKGYLDNLLNAKLTINPPNPIPKLIAYKAKAKVKIKHSRSRKKSQPVDDISSIRNITGEQIRKARQAKNWSQAKLANALGVSQKFISMIERGERNLNLELILEILQLLEM